MDLLLAERLLLLSLDPRTGKPYSYPRVALPLALSSASLAELVSRGAARMEGDRLVAVHWTGDPLLDQILGLMGVKRQAPTFTYWVSSLGDYRKYLLRRLVERGVLAERQQKVLGIFSTTRHVLVAPAALEETAAPLRQVLLGQTRGIPFQVGVLAALAGVTGLASRVVPPPFQQEAAGRAQAIARCDPAAQAVTTLILQMRTAATAAAVSNGAVMSTVMISCGP